MADDSGRRVELVAGPTASKTETGRVGAGLFVGLIVARNSLIGAATGAEVFESAVAHFVGVVLLCVGCALFIGNVYDRAVRHAARSDAENMASPAVAQLVEAPATALDR